MARPLRIEYEGAGYHVTNRGNAGNKVFERDDDYELFLEKLCECVLSFRISLRSYCLMPDHFHLYFVTPEGNLCKFMQTFMTAFTVTKNRRDKRNGHIFQGRYKSILVDNDSYGSKVSQYIHLTPARKENLSAPKISSQECLVTLRHYKWSSYPFLLGIWKCPEWLDRQEVLSHWGDSLMAQQDNYSEFVECGLMHEIGDPFETAAAKTVLGTVKFVDYIRRRLTSLFGNMPLARSQPNRAKLEAWVDIDELINLVCKEFRTSREKVLKTHSRKNMGRKALLYLAGTYCRGRYTLAEIGQRLGITDVGLSTARHVVRKQMKEQTRFASRIEKIERQLHRKPKVMV